jgi:hypothetical protein
MTFMVLMGVGFENYLTTIEKVWVELFEVPARTKILFGFTSKTEIESISKVLIAASTYNSMISTFSVCSRMRCPSLVTSAE